MILLTGHRGFIGGHILRELLGSPTPLTVIGCDPLLLPSDYYEAQRYQATPANPGFTFSDYVCYAHELPEDLLSQVTHVINCGAESHVDRSYKDYDAFYNANVLSPLRLAYALKPGTAFLQVSTDEVFCHDSQPFSETSQHAPTNPYSRSKELAEQVLHAFCETRRIQYGVTNGANTYGPGQYWEKIIPKTVYNAVNGLKIPLYETPAQRMWLHVSDHAKGILRALYAISAPGASYGQRFCLAPDAQDELYTHDLVRMILDILGLPAEDYIEIVPDRPNYDLRYWMLNDKAKQELHWVPEKHIADELERVVRYYEKCFTENTLL